MHVCVLMFVCVHMCVHEREIDLGKVLNKCNII